MSAELLRRARGSLAQDQRLPRGGLDASTNALKVAIVGQVPPPPGGQAAMIQLLLRASSPDVHLMHVSMTFSRAQGEMGQFQLRKIGHLLGLVPRILRARLRGATVLYYPPSGHGRLPIARDLTVLILCRWAFPATVFHFHAGGLSDAYPHQGWRRWLYDFAYARPQLAIRPSRFSPPDGACVRAQREAIVPYGVPDHGLALKRTDLSLPIRILFVGLLRESKGVLVLLDACRILLERDVRFSLRLVGDFHTEEFRRQAVSFLQEHQLQEQVELVGTLAPDALDRCYKDADVFCFPTFFESENMPIVVLLAMSFGLPIVASRWRAISGLLAHEETGLLVDTHDSVGVANELTRIARDPALSGRLGAAARMRYESEYSEPAYQSRVIELLRGVGVRTAQPEGRLA